MSLAIDGFASTGGYRVNRWLIDATHNNTYGTYVAAGLNAAIAAEQLQQLDTQLVTQLSLIPDLDLAPYAVMLLEIERLAGTSGCTSPSTVGDARLNLRKLQAPSGDDQLKLRGTVAVTTSPPIDPGAQGLRLILTTMSFGRRISGSHSRKNSRAKSAEDAKAILVLRRVRGSIWRIHFRGDDVVAFSPAS